MGESNGQIRIWRQERKGRDAARVCDRRWASVVQQCQTFQGTDVDSDHSLVIANIKIKLKRKHREKRREQRNIARLGEEDIKRKYQQVLETKLKDQSETWDMNKRAEQLTQAMLEAVEQAIPLQEKIKKKWITQETMRLIEEKRDLKKRRNISELNERTFRAKCNEVRKSARADKTRWL